MKNYGDICTIDGGLAEQVDCIIGGSPCQNLSIAGNRLGLEGKASSLFLEQIRVVQEMRKATGFSKPRYMVWENVQGALSCNKGKDFQAVLDLCVRTCVIPKERERESYDDTENNESKNETYSETTVPHVPMPKDGKWPNAGVLYDDLGRWSLAWRVHDAQFWGVAQRRRRLALVVDFGGMSASEVLFEQQGVSGNTDTCNSQGEGTARASDECITEPDKVWDARGNGNGHPSATLTGDHDNRITDYTNVVYGIDDVRAGTQRPVVMEDCSPTLISHSENGVCAPTCCVGNGQVHDAISPSVELSKTLNCPIDPMKIVLPVVEDSVKSEEPWLLESNQNHATVTNTGVSTTLPASMGLGGGYVPMVTEREHSPIVIDRAAFNQGENAMFDPHIKEEETMPTLVSRGPHAVCCPSNREVEVYSVAENGSRDVRLSKTAYSLTCGGGKPGQSYPCICIGNGQSHVTEHYTEEVSQTLNCMHDPMTILEPCACQLGGVNSNSMDSSSKNSVCSETGQACTIATNGDVPNDPGGHTIFEPSETSKVYGICSYSSNCMKSSNPHSGVYEAETSRTLDTVSCGNPVCCQGGMAVVEVAQPVQYRVRRLTPLECTRLQGYPDGWVDIGDWTDSKGKKHKDSDAPKYKALGNSIALPFWRWLCRNIITTLQSQGNVCPTMASLFDGIGGFPLCWAEATQSKGSVLWISEIEEFPLAVTRSHF